MTIIHEFIAKWRKVELKERFAVWKRGFPDWGYKCKHKDVAFACCRPADLSDEAILERLLVLNQAVAVAA